MSSGPPTQGHYLLAASGKTAYVRVVGLATMNNSAPLEEVLEDLHRHGCDQFIFDLSSCTGFDSTFMGLLVGLARREPAEPGGPAAGGSVVLVNSSEVHRRLLAEVGLDRVVRLRSEPIDFPAVELRRVDGAHVDPRLRIRSIVAAHENLVRLGGANIEKFSALLECLKRELDEDGQPRR
jgi:anti-anti-sigma regulatory factor